VSCRVEPEERKQQPTSRVVSCRVAWMMPCSMGGPRPASYLSAGRTEREGGPRHSALFVWVSGSVTSPRRRSVPRENPRVFSFFGAPEACDAGRGHVARASAEPERGGAPLPARIGQAIRLLGQCGAEQCGPAGDAGGLRGKRRARHGNVVASLIASVRRRRTGLPRRQCAGQVLGSG
jgi:hypothetical protein